MAYIEVRTTLPDHRKLRSAARALHVDRFKLIGHLVTLWIWALDNVPSHGVMDGLSDTDLEEAAGWPEEMAGELVPALIEAGFIDDEDGVRYLHDWDEYAGRLLKKREADRERKRAERAQIRAEKRPTDKRKSRADVRRSTAARADVQNTSQTRPADTPASPADNGASPPRQPAKSRASRASARGRTVPHRTDTVSREVEEKEVPPTARGTAAAAAGSSPRNLIELDRPDVKALKRKGWTRLSAEQLAILDEIAWRQCDGDPELDPGKLASGRRWCASVIRSAPKGVSLLEHLVDHENRIRAERQAKADAEEEAWQRQKAGERAAAEASPIAQRVVGNGIGPAIARQSALSHDKALLQLRRVRGQLNADAWQALLERYGVTEDELDAADADELSEAAHG